ncbi:MAG TPA: HAD-IA family hydrolase [Opitutus sp.]|nr:HAD-IA family hydrolase [Opitutus sp.]
MPQPATTPRREPRAFDAALFDMDGVVTDTAAVHAAAWQRMFDEFLRRRAETRSEPFTPFSPTQDYLRHVDGKPRYQGVAAFLASRGIVLPFGSATDPAGAETVCGLGNRKNELFNAIVAAEGVRVYESTIALIHALRAAGIRIGLATSSRNAAVILGRSATTSLFATVVDGLVSEKRGLQGKPHPDIFAAACTDLSVSCARAVVFEDAVSGVQAGARGGFALVIGVARAHNARELRENGADVIVSDLAEIDLAEINLQVRLKAAGR